MHVSNSVVCVNGLGLRLHVCVNLIMKFIYTPCKCKCIVFIYIHVSVSVKKNYIILNGPIKQCNM